jgi:hypothetical protein
VATVLSGPNWTPPPTIPIKKIIKKTLKPFRSVENIIKYLSLIEHCYFGGKIFRILRNPLYI